MSKMIDLTGQTFGYWKVLSRGENTKTGRTQWLCHCQACGTEKLVDGAHLRSGCSTNCGCIRLQKMIKANTKNEVGKRYGRLTVLERGITPPGKRGVYWKCQCSCGNIVTIKGDYLRNGDTQSCGCLLSKGEENIQKILTAHDIKFIHEFNFERNPCLGSKGYPLSFDFAIFNKDGSFSHLIEYDGIQHFKTAENGWNNADTLKQTQCYDNIKNEYCKNNNIKLIRIKYDQEYSFEDLMP